jgi:hypothetical protein
MKIRNRIKELRRVPAKELLPNPKNWRVHPPAQKEALQGLLGELGYCDATVARELPDGKLQLIDGHLRCETTPDMKVPVLVLDVTEAEADKLLVTLDPLASLAQADRAALTALLACVDTDNAAMQALLDDLAAGELASFLDREAVPGRTDPDAIPEPPDEAMTQLAPFLSPRRRSFWSTMALGTAAKGLPRRAPSRSASSRTGWTPPPAPSGSGRTGGTPERCRSPPRAPPGPGPSSWPCSTRKSEPAK